LQKIQFDPESIVAILRATSKATHFLKNNRGEFLKLLEKESGIKDERVASLIYEDALDNLSDTGIPSEAAMLETIASIKEAARITRDVSMAEVFDFSFARKALK
jgi:ABC-type nitrate/sulfonate/bicarbonate transport system substrate-binding protein